MLAQSLLHHARDTAQWQAEREIEQRADGEELPGEYGEVARQAIRLRSQLDTAIRLRIEESLNI